MAQSYYTGEQIPKEWLCGIFHLGMLKVPCDLTLAALNAAQDAQRLLFQLRVAARRWVTVHAAFEIVIQVLVGIQLRGVGRQVKHLDVRFVFVQRLLDRSVVMHAQVVENQENLVVGVLLIFTSSNVAHAQAVFGALSHTKGRSPPAVNAFGAMFIIAQTAPGHAANLAFQTRTETTFNQKGTSICTTYKIASERS